MKKRKVELVAELEEMRRVMAEKDEQIRAAREELQRAAREESSSSDGDSSNENENQMQNDARIDDEEGNTDNLDVTIRNEEVDNEQVLEMKREMEEMMQKIQELQEQKEYFQNQAQLYVNLGREDENLREIKMKKLAAETEKTKFENITKRIGPYNSNMNSDVWTQRLEFERASEELSWEYFLRSMRHFFTATTDTSVKTWFERKEILIVPKLNQATTEDERKVIWEQFRDEFTAQYDPKVRAQLAEEKYEQFELKDEMTADDFVNQLQDVLLETDPFMASELVVRKMHRKLPVGMRTQIADPYLSTVPKFLQRLQAVLTAERGKVTKQDEKEKKKDESAKTTTSNSEAGESSTKSESLSLRVFQGQCYFCKKIGHRAEDCRTKKREEEQARTEAEYGRGASRGRFNKNFGRGNNYRGMSHGRGSIRFRGQGRGFFRGRGLFRGQPFRQGTQEPSVRVMLQELLQRQGTQPSGQQAHVQVPAFQAPVQVPAIQGRPQQQLFQDPYKQENC